MAAATTSPHKQHNEDLLKRLKPGDLVRFERGSIVQYFHWALYIGDCRVIHLSPRGDGSSSSLSCGTQEKGEIKEENFWKVADKSKAYLGNMEHEGWIPLEASEIIKRARKMIGQFKYNLVAQNCEHIAKWFRYSRKESQQVEDALKYMDNLTIAAAQIR